MSQITGTKHMLPHSSVNIHSDTHNNLTITATFRPVTIRDSSVYFDIINTGGLELTLSGFAFKYLTRDCVWSFKITAQSVMSKN